MKKFLYVIISLLLLYGVSYGLPPAPPLGGIASSGNTQTWGDGTGPVVWTFSVTGTDPTWTMITGKATFSGGIEATSFTVPKVSGTASRSLLYESNSTDTNGTGWEGPASVGSDLYLKHSNSDPAANQLMLFPAPTAGVSTYAWTTYGQFSSLPVDTNSTITGYAKVVEVTGDCTIGSNCDSTSVLVAKGGLIFATAAANVTLPEIVASSPSATQVTIGAYICLMSRDQNEVLTVHPNAADSFTPKDHAKQTAGNHMIETVSASTGAGNMICFLAAEADNWMQMGTVGTWDHE
jgi:hypothetical protein